MLLMLASTTATKKAIVKMVGKGQRERLLSTQCSNVLAPALKTKEYIYQKPQTTLVKFSPK